MTPVLTLLNLQGVEKNVSFMLIGEAYQHFDLIRNRDLPNTRVDLVVIEISCEWPSSK